MPTINTSKGKIHFNSKMLYVGIKQIDRDIAFENFKEVANELSIHCIHWGPFLGTMLGIIRENNFIEWDEDVDIYVLEEDEEKLKDALWSLIELGFEVVRYERRGLYSIMKNGEYIDFYILKKIAPGLRHSGGGDFIFEKYLIDSQDFDFKGVKVPIPLEYDEYLTFHYGDWRTPVKWADFELGWFKRVYLKVKNLIKNNLPDSVYFYLLAKHHSKDLEKFKQKCINKGCPISHDLKLTYK